MNQTRAPYDPDLYWMVICDLRQQRDAIQRTIDCLESIRQAPSFCHIDASRAPTITAFVASHWREFNEVIFENNPPPLPTGATGR